MDALKRSILLIFLLLFSGNLTSQDTFQELDRIYGLDPLLFNGKKYSYFLPSGTGGNQFIYSSEFVKGDLVIRGKRFSDIYLNYDIYNQQLLLQYTDETGASQIIDVSTAWLDGFSLGTANFKYLAFERETRIYQVLGNETIQVLYSWRKSLKLSNSSGPSHYSFSQPVKTQYVLLDGKLHPYRSVGSFIKIFNEELKDETRKYIQTNNINLKKASDEIITELINFISNLK